MPLLTGKADGKNTHLTNARTVYEQFRKSTPGLAENNIEKISQQKRTDQQGHNNNLPLSGHGKICDKFTKQGIKRKVPFGFAAKTAGRNSQALA